MRIAIWHTGHEIADRVAACVYDGLKNGHTLILVESIENNLSLIQDYDIHIGYGILRGMAEVFRACDKVGKPWFNIDRGYWNPGHYDGYYRVSLRGTQQTFGLNKIKPDYERWEKLEISVQDSRAASCRDKVLVCPPTDYAMHYFGIKPLDWIKVELDQNWRGKSSDVPLQNDLDSAKKVITFNSAVGWEGLRQGIPVISDPIHSIVGAYQKLFDKPLHDDYAKRIDLFALQAALQLTLDEIRQGKLWPLMMSMLSL